MEQQQQQQQQPLSTITQTLNNQENNQLLLNAIKNKFAAQTDSETQSFSPPKFNIPMLNVAMKLGTPPGNLLEQNESPAQQQTQLNNFLLQQLKDKQANNNNANSFVVPALQLTATTKTNVGISNLTKAINKLQVQENNTQTTSIATPSIDLTSALSSRTNHQNTSPQRSHLLQQQRRQNSESENLHNFDIPFIECDRQDSTILKVIANEYCVTDVSDLALQPTIVVQPSAIGCILDVPCLKYKPATFTLITASRKRSAQTKHTIEPFLFNTKSPDDLVLESLNKIKRRIVA